MSNRLQYCVVITHSISTLPMIKSKSREQVNYQGQSNKKCITEARIHILFYFPASVSSSILLQLAEYNNAHWAFSILIEKRLWSLKLSYVMVVDHLYPCYQLFFKTRNTLKFFLLAYEGDAVRSSGNTHSVNINHIQICNKGSQKNTSVSPLYPPPFVSTGRKKMTSTDNRKATRLIGQCFLICVSFTIHLLSVTSCPVTNLLKLLPCPSLTIMEIYSNNFNYLYNIVPISKE